MMTREHGVECLENTISEEFGDYSNSEYVWNSNPTALQVLDGQSSPNLCVNCS